nr:MSMEG_0570 family nitrogen starvation response protein [Acaryochloris sp. CCMEE 5410]
MNKKDSPHFVSTSTTCNSPCAVKVKVRKSLSPVTLCPMPEIRFQIQWPDGTQETCYSPSLVVKDYLEPGNIYELSDFIARSQTALTIASNRVKAKYGMPCSLALGQLQSLETRAQTYQDLANPKVQMIQFIS